ncbi:MAG: hypothetical protein ACRDXX_05530 [Stackebrandtia sp.]
MVTYTQLRDLDTSKLTTAASSAGSLGSALSTRGSDVATKANIPSGMWDGADAQAAMSLLSPQSGPLYDASDAFSHSQGILEDLVDGLEKAKSRLDDAQTLAAGAGLTIGPDGSVNIPEVDSRELYEDKLEKARQVKQLIDEAVDMADEVDGIAVEEIKNKKPLQEYLPNPEDMPINLPLMQAFYDWAGVVDGWGEGQFRFDDNGLSLFGIAGAGLKEKFLLGENGEYGSLTGMLGAEANGNLSVGPQGASAGLSGFAGASGTYTTPKVEVAPGLDGQVGLTGRAGVGAEASANVGYDDGKLKLGGKLGASWGLGGSIAPSVTIDVPEVADNVGNAAKSVNKVMPWSW